MMKEMADSEIVWEMGKGIMREMMGDRRGGKVERVGAYVKRRW